MYVSKGRMGARWGWLLVVLALLPSVAAAQTYAEEDAPREFKPHRFWPVVGGIAVADVGAMYALNQLWYEAEGQTSFAFYSDRLSARFPGFETDGWLDDWHTYKQQDKLGHLFTTWQLARVVGEYGRWTGLSNWHAALFGGAVASLFQSQIEIFDGFSREYGFSRTDVLANTVGGVIGGLQVAYPEQTDWFAAKYSYHRSPYYDDQVSSLSAVGYLGNAVKDYDGISYWLVIRPNELVGPEMEARWPDWLAFSIGHSGDGLAHPISGVQGPEHQRQLFLSLDIDLTPYIDRLPAPLQPVASFFSFVRIPAPAVEFGRGTRWHWLYY